MFNLCTYNIYVCSRAAFSRLYVHLSRSIVEYVYLYISARDLQCMDFISRIIQHCVMWLSKGTMPFRNSHNNGENVMSRM